MATVVPMVPATCPTPASNAKCGCSRRCVSDGVIECRRNARACCPAGRGSRQGSSRLARLLRKPRRRAQLRRVPRLLEPGRPGHRGSGRRSAWTARRCHRSWRLVAFQPKFARNGRGACSPTFCWEHRVDVFVRAALEVSGESAIERAGDELVAGANDGNLEASPGPSLPPPCPVLDRHHLPGAPHGLQGRRSATAQLNSGKIPSPVWCTERV